MSSSAEAALPAAGHRASCLALAALILLAAPAPQAKRLYKYTDADGNIHYTDRRPPEDVEADSWLVEVEQGKLVTVRRQQMTDHTRVLAFNHWHGPVELQLALDEATNITTDPALPTSLVIESYGEAPVLTVRVADPRQSARYSLQYRATPGDPAVVVDPYLYRPPFRPGQRHYIGQGFGGIASHTEEQGYHAVDLGLPEGTPVLAARPGVVMNVEEDFFGAGLNRERFGGRANSVRVLHDDGTMALYAHLQVESVAVRPGREVKAGELLGLSGNTGYSSGPHLHFVIQRNAGGKVVSIPFRFDDGSTSGWEPQPGYWLEHRRGDAPARGIRH